jgi:hypothetical protein
VLSDGGGGNVAGGGVFFVVSPFELVEPDCVGVAVSFAAGAVPVVPPVDAC